MPKYLPEIIFISLVMIISLTGFWGLYFGEDAHANGYHHLHVISNFAWLILIAVQLIFIKNRKHKLHRKLGYAVFLVGPFIFSSLALLSVYSANRAAEAGTADSLVVQNVTVTIEVGLMIFLAFIFRRKVKVHGAFILSSALLFMGIALFFTLLTFVPAYKIEGPETFGNFGKAAAMATYISTALGGLMFLRDLKNGWPWLVAISFFYLNGFIDDWVRATENLQSLTNFIGGFRFHFVFIISFAAALMLLILAWRMAVRRTGRV